MTVIQVASRCMMKIFMYTMLCLFHIKEQLMCIVLCIKVTTRKMIHRKMEIGICTEVTKTWYRLIVIDIMRIWHMCYQTVVKLVIVVIPQIVHITKSLLHMHEIAWTTQGPLGYVSALGATRLVHWLILVAPSCLRSHNARYIMLKSLSAFCVKCNEFPLFFSSHWQSLEQP